MSHDQNWSRDWKDWLFLSGLMLPSINLQTRRMCYVMLDHRRALHTHLPLFRFWTGVRLTWTPAWTKVGGQERHFRGKVVQINMSSCNPLNAKYQWYQLESPWNINNVLRVWFSMSRFGYCGNSHYKWTIKCVEFQKTFQFKISDCLPQDAVFCIMFLNVYLFLIIMLYFHQDMQQNQGSRKQNRVWI